MEILTIIVEIPEYNKNFSVTVDKHSRIEVLCVKLNQDLGLPSAVPVTLSFEG
jgi:hypothetical protein